METPAIEVRDLVVRYGDRAAVDGVSFTAAAGEVVAVLGPNGAGKTTTVETLEGYRRPSAGTVRVLGLDPVADRAALAPRIGVMLQEGGVYPGMSPREALRLFAAYYASPEDPTDLLVRVGLDGAPATTPWRKLSGGEKQRLSLALALVGRPDVAFLDEPSAGMDPAARRSLWDVVTGLRDRGCCVLLTTHYVEEAERLASRVVVLDRGRVVAAGTTAELVDTGPGQVRFTTTSGVVVDDLASRLGRPVREETPGRYLVEADATPELVGSVTAWLTEHGLPLHGLQTGGASLEDVYLALTSAPSTGDAAR